VSGEGSPGRGAARGAARVDGEGPAARPPVPACPGCGLSVRLAPGEVERIIAEYFRGRTPELVPADEAGLRLAICASCPDLLYGSTCRHCGCLVELRARLAGKACPAPAPRW
jgi:hypothetical protein